MGDASRGYKTLRKVWLMYLEITLQQASCHYSIHKSKYHKFNKNEVFKDKQATRKVPLLFLKF